MQRRSWVLASPKDGAAVNIMKDDIKFVGLVGEPAIIKENIGPFPSLNFAGDANWFAGRHIAIKNG